MTAKNPARREISLRWIVVVYLAFALSWIRLSDWFVLQLVQDPERLTLIQEFKGSAFVLISAALIFGLLQAAERARHQVQVALQDSDARLRNALTATGIGTWSWDFTADRIRWSGGDDAFQGLAPAEFEGSYEEFEKHIHAADREGLRLALRGAQADGSECDHECRLAAASGGERWIAWCGRVAATASGATHMTGAMWNISRRKQAEAELRQSEERLASVFRATPSAIVVVRAKDEQVLAVNPAFERMLGFTAAEALGRTTRELGIYADHDLRPAVIARIRAAGSLDNQEVRLRRKDGRVVDCLSSGEAIDFGGEACWLSVTRDITELKQAASALRESEERYRMVVNNTGDIIWLFDLSVDRFVYVSPSVERLSGFTPEEMKLRNLEKMLTAQSYGQVLGDLAEALAAAEANTTSELIHVSEVDVIRKDGSIMPTETVASLLRDRQGQATQLLGVTRDITARRQAERELRESRERLQHMSNRLLEVQEEERSRLARELHDGVGQVLTAAKIKLQSVERFSDPAAQSRRLAEAVALMDRSLEEVRAISANLRPPTLDDLGLVASLQWLLDRFTRDAGIEAHFQADEVGRVDPTIETACFRVAQEALANAVRHSRASQLWVDLRVADGLLCMRVRDNGVGFDLAEARRRTTSGRGLGLLGMHERVALLNGKVEVTSAPDCGTFIRVCFPLQPPSPGPAAG